jgi:hypothetical protein
MTGVPTPDEFRAVGFTADAVNYPRDDLAWLMLAAFNNVRPDQIPAAARYFPNEATKAAWDRVAAVLAPSRFDQTSEQTAETAEAIENIGGPGRTRTSNQTVMSDVVDS